jgi:hypothetical protein
MNKPLSRRTVLRGMLGGMAVSIGLPLLEIFLNDNGTALAGGAPLPLRFGTWFWGCGMNPDRWAPPTEGPDYELSPELQVLGDLKSQVSVLSGYNVFLDGRPNEPHYTGVLANLTGTTPLDAGYQQAPTFDTLISAIHGASTRFRSLELSATGVPSQSFSRESDSVINAALVSPMEAYARIFGADFFDPKDGPFVPDPKTVLRRSALSAVAEDSQRLEKRLGSHDKQRLDQYFTSLRQLERQIEISLTPPNLEACRRPAAPRNEDIGTEVSQANATHDLLADLLVFALLCDQTRVFNMVFSWALSDLRILGEDIAHHQLTHDEPVDPELGYQPRATAFSQVSMQAWARFVRKLATTPEGDGTLLDNCLVMAHSEHSFAKSHLVVGLPVMLAGRAGGRVVPGVHVRGNGEPISRIGLTIQQLMGVPISEWGSGSMQVSHPIGEILA